MKVQVGRVELQLTFLPSAGHVVALHSDMTLLITKQQNRHTQRVIRLAASSLCNDSGRIDYQPPFLSNTLRTHAKELELMIELLEAGLFGDLHF
jgi:hypothetical protein